MTTVDMGSLGKQSVYQNEESRFYEWAKKIEQYRIGIEPQLDVLLDWAF